jgi:hypothetical protein
MSALQALAGMAGSQTPAGGSDVPTAPQPANHVGTWAARLANGASVQLELQANGQFSWTARNKSGQTSTFQGSYSVANGTLTLTRTNDNQQLVGAFNASSQNAFNFKLTGAKDAGLSFVRA